MLCDEDLNDEDDEEDITESSRIKNIRFGHHSTLTSGNKALEALASTERGRQAFEKLIKMQNKESYI